MNYCIEAKLVLKNYVPVDTQDLLFPYEGDNGFLQVKTISIPKYMEVEKVIEEYGYPVELYVIYEGNPNIHEIEVLATPDVIGWWDDSEDSDELYELSIEVINQVLDNGGEIEIETDEDGSPILTEDKVVLRHSILPYDEEYEEDDDE